MAAVEKPDQIRRLEQHLGLRLHPLRTGNVADYQNRKCYEIDDQGEIVGLNLHSCPVADWSFLKGLSRLTSLALWDNKITNGSFLQGMTQLTSLDLAGTQIADGSFLKGLTQLTSLNLAGTQIADWSFLQGMTQLSSLDLRSNGITDGSFLKGMTQLTSLALGYNGITDWTFLKGMTQLTSLDLGGNKITDGSFLQGMTQLTSLDLSGTPIADGAFLKGMTQLTTLDLAGTPIADGAFLNGMTQLTSLRLGGNPITDWSFLKGLTRLTSLDLGGNETTDWSFLKGMTQLTSLDLAGNEITDGSFLQGMTQLTSLGLWSTRITDWSFLNGLTRLTSLHLGGNGITDGAFLNGMTQLTSLRLGGNEIKDGSFLNGMTRLTSLHLSGTQLADWSFLRGLTQLTTLELRNGNLRTLPEELLLLNIDLEWHNPFGRPHSVNLAGNPIETPPLEIVKQGDRAIRSWFAERDEGVVPLNEVKVILVGDGEAGKTTLRKRLMGLPPDSNESQTHGIEIHPHPIRCGADEIRVHFWDFGGQEILHATHQFFLSRRSLYIVVLDGRKEEDVDYWLKHIESFGGNSPVLICLNKMDQNPSFDVNRADLKAKYPGIREFYRLKCLENNDAGVAQLRNELPDHLMGVELTRAEWPRRWFAVKEQLRKEDKPFLERADFESNCRQAGITDAASQQALIRYLNDLGVALHFEDNRLDLLQILNPKWATQAVYRLISAHRVAQAGGLLKLGDLREILTPTKPDDYEYPREKHTYIVDLMRKFQLCYDVNTQEVLLPDLLGVGEPAHEFPTENVLRLRYEYDYLPKSILPRLIVKLHAYIEGELRWRTGVVLHWRGWDTHGRVKSDKNDKRVTVEVAGSLKREFFAVVFEALETIHETFTKLTIKRKVPLPDHPEVAVDYEDLIYHRAMKRRTILVGAVKKEYVVEKLLDGVYLPLGRKVRTAAGTRTGNTFIERVEHYHEGDDVNVNIGDGNQKIALVIGNNVSLAVADTIQNSFNQAATAKSDELKDLLQQLAQEMAKVIETLPEQEAKDAADHLENAVKQATAEKPSKSFWEFSREKLIGAAKMAGAVVKQGVSGAAAAAAIVKDGVAGVATAAAVAGTKVAGLLDQIGKLLPF